MTNIYLRVPTYVAQFYRGRDMDRPMDEQEPVVFCEYQHEHILMKHTLQLIPETEQTNSWCYSHRAWKYIMAGKPPTGEKQVLKRDAQQWPSVREICMLIGEKNTQKLDGYDYLCIQIPREVLMGDEIRRTNASYSLAPKAAMSLQRLLRDEYVHTFLDWLVQDRRYCNAAGINRRIGTTIERFFERYYISIGKERTERDSMLRMGRRWIEQAKLLPNDRVDFSATDIHYVDEKEEERKDRFNFEKEIEKELCEQS